MAEIKKTPNLGLAINADDSIKFKDWHRIVNGEGPVKENETDETVLVEKSNTELVDLAYAAVKEELETELETREQVDGKLQEQIISVVETKQDKLAAGTGIVLEDAVVSVDEDYLNKQLSAINNQIEQVKTELDAKADLNITTDDTGFVNTLTVNKKDYSVFAGKRPELETVMTRSGKSGHTIPVQLWAKSYADVPELYNDWDAITAAVLNGLEELKRVGFIAKYKEAELQGETVYHKLTFNPTDARESSVVNYETILATFNSIKDRLAEYYPDDLESVREDLDSCIPMLATYFTASQFVACTSTEAKNDRMVAIADLEVNDLYAKVFEVRISLSFNIKQIIVYTMDDVNLNINLKIN